MSSSSAPTISTVGPSPIAAGHRSQPATVRYEPLSPDPLEFARRVRSQRWQSFAPLLVTLLFGAALAFTAAAAPATVTVQRMLNGEGERQAITASSERLDLSTGYELPSHWQWPGLADATGVGTLVVCHSNDAPAFC